MQRNNSPRPSDDYLLELYASNPAPVVAEILGRKYNTVRMWIQEAKTGKRHHVGRVR